MVLIRQNQTSRRLRSIWMRNLRLLSPKTEHFVKDMVIRYQFKEVTYETLHEEAFIASLHKAFPYAGLPDIPIKEYKAAPVKK